MYPLLSYKMNILHFMNDKKYDYDTSIKFYCSKFKDMTLIFPKITMKWFLKKPQWTTEINKLPRSDVEYYFSW